MKEWHHFKEDNEKKIINVTVTVAYGFGLSNKAGWMKFEITSPQAFSQQGDQASCERPLYMKKFMKIAPKSFKNLLWEIPLGQN